MASRCASVAWSACHRRLLYCKSEILLPGSIHPHLVRCMPCLWVHQSQFGARLPEPVCCRPDARPRLFAATQEAVRRPEFTSSIGHVTSPDSTALRRTAGGSSGRSTCNGGWSCASRTSPIQRPFRSGGFQSSQALPAAGAVRCLSSAAAAAAGTAVDAPPAAAACWPLAARFNPRCAVPSHPIHPIRDRWIAPPACGSRHTPAPGLEPVISPVPAHPANSLLLFSPPLLPCASTSLPPVRVTRTSTLVPSPRLQPLLDVFAVAFWPLQIFIGRRVRCVVRVVSCPVPRSRAVPCSAASAAAVRRETVSLGRIPRPESTASFPSSQPYRRLFD